MKVFLEPLKELNEYVEAKRQLSVQGTPIHLTGCVDSQKCHVMYGMGEDRPYKVIVTYNEAKAKEIYEDYKVYDKNVFFYPAKDLIFYSADVHGRAIVEKRLRIVRRLLEGEPVTVVVSIEGGMEYCLPIGEYRRKQLTLRQAGTVVLEDVSKRLVALGYENVAQVEKVGEFSVRGGILDVFPLTEETPYRIELWGDEVDTIRAFDVESQRSIERVGEITVYPATEVFMEEGVAARGLRNIEREKDSAVAALRKDFHTEEAYRLEKAVEQFKEDFSIFQGMVGLESYIHFFFEETSSFFDYFDADKTVFFLDEPMRAMEKGDATEMEFRESMMGRLEKGYVLPSQTGVIYSCSEIMAKLRRKPLVLLSTMDYKVKNIAVKHKFDFTLQSVQAYNNNFELLVKDMERWKGKNYRILLLSTSTTRAKRLSEDLREFGLNAFYGDDMERVLHPGEIMTATGNLHRGFEYPLIRFVVISEGDIFGAQQKKRRKRKTYEGKNIQSFSDLNVGDYVVHENYGVGVYRGMEKIDVEKVTKDYLKIEYAADGVLYVPATNMDVLQRYAGSDAKRLKLSKLNSTEWKKTKAKVKTAVREVAEELVTLYAKRQEKDGFAFGKDTVWQTEFEEMFQFEETEDQLLAIEETKKDMESTRIMDRLICGDVGYGKTEIAIRAAFKAVSDGKQVALLVPTTILAQQHYNTFVQRMMDFPVSVDMLSRFRTPTEQRNTLARLRKGALDIIIGTHRLLSKDVEFKQLGLLVVDEEQRFGVTHKEKIKLLKEDVDVLTLSATPIPRTLHMSLVGIRDMSVLEEPPVDRMPIQTFVMEYNEEIVREAIHRELVRGGQVYYVHNRVENIDQVTSAIATLVPDANIAFAHGQMNERQLERIMFDFINGHIDVLVSTTIIETGLDISNVNTMIIDEADRMGLSQLYQLRGRVGRSNRTAYAFLMYKRNKMLREVAEKRLQAIKEFTELGSGFKVAMRDLEIRGAGSLLGERQHGHMEAVGYDLYCKMLNEAVKSVRGEGKEEEEFETSIEMDVSAYIPSTYVKSEYQKLDMYKRVAEVENVKEYTEMLDELVDRFGECPKEVENLVRISLLKSMAHRVGVQQVVQKERAVKLHMHEKANMDVARIPDLVREYQGRLKFHVEAHPYFSFQPAKGESHLDALQGLLEAMGKGRDEVVTLRRTSEQ